ncbi:DUF2306 domain-containing protein [Actinosynnema sp. NPDC091369]
MTTIDQRVEADGAQRSPGRRPRWLRELWVVPFAVYCLGFTIYGGYRYVTLDPALSRVPLRPEVPLHYTLLTAHVLTGMVAAALAWLQVWPWLRETHPVVHRRIGWVYYLVGVFPSVVLAFPVAVFTPAGQAIRLVLIAMSTLWAITVVAGFRAVLQRRYEDHRRWMYRNVAMTTTIITSRWVGMLGIEVTLVLLPETYGTQQRLLFEGMNATALWTAITVHLLFVEWVVLRPRRRRRAAANSRAAAAVAR